MLAIYKEASLSMIMIISAIFIMSLGFIVWYGTSRQRRKMGRWLADLSHHRRIVPYTPVKSMY
ncbi:hypothetical protein ABIA69_001143 [Lysinibacillus parviboronicapiens]|uniref:Uncharacterized protein n=1 Tax=Lysinibacillus parviboronicapiens TaxID=436516 RepID=A0ABV2PGG3_9BACI